MITTRKSNLMKKELDAMESEVAFRIQKGYEAEVRGRKELEEAYCSGYDDGFADGAAAGYEKGECETWDEAFDAGWRAAKEDSGL